MARPLRPRSAKYPLLIVLLCVIGCLLYLELTDSAERASARQDSLDISLAQSRRNALGVTEASPPQQLPSQPPPSPPPPRPEPRPPAEPALSHALLRAVHRDPSLLLHQAVARAFLPTPWLLPEGEATAQLLPYWGLHNDLDALLHARSQPMGDFSKAISTVYFSHHHSVLLQNWVYTAVKWAGIENYIVVSWDDTTLAACLAMHLPCYNATAYLSAPLKTGSESKFYLGDFIPITWVKPLLARDLLAKGYLTHVSDVDVAFPPKAFWPSTLRLLGPTGAEATMERDMFGPVNIGTMVLLPTARALAWANAWGDRAANDTASTVSSQKGLALMFGQAYEVCEGPWNCLRIRQEMDEDPARQGRLLIRRYPGAFDAIYHDHCAGFYLDWASPVDPCAPSALHYHIVCVSGAANKIKGMKGNGLWFMDDENTHDCLDSPLEGDVAGGEEEWEAWWEAIEKAPAEEGAGEQQAQVEAAGQEQPQADPAAGEQQAEPQAGEQQAQPSERASEDAGAEAGVVPGVGEGDSDEGSVARSLLAAPEAGRGQEPGWSVGAAQRGLLEDGEGGGPAAAAGAGAVPRCAPLVLRLPRHERAWQMCDKKQLAYVYYPQQEE